MDLKEKMPFDQYQRYATISSLIEFHRTGDADKIFKILELGSNEHKDLAVFLKKDKITFTDIILTEKLMNDPDFMQVDGSHMPFGDKEFDFVVSADVLEHVPADKRIDFISEACRVSRIGAVICFPENTEDVRGAEARVNSYYKVLNSEDFIWLKEHIENGLPDTAEIEDYLEANHIDFFSLSHGRVDIWEKMWYSIFNSIKMPELLDYQSKIINYYNTNIFSCDIGGKCYRTFYVISHEKADQWKRYGKGLWKTGPTDVFDHLNTLFKAYNEIQEIYFNNKISGNNHGTVYYDLNGFSEINTVKINHSEGRILSGRINIPDGCTDIRFDPVEGYSCILSDLVIGSSNGILTMQSSNADGIAEGNYFFSTADPQLYISVPTGTLWIEISCNIVVLESIFAQKAVWDMRNEISELEIINARNTEKYNLDIAQLREENKRQLEEKDEYISGLREENWRQLEEKDKYISGLREENQRLFKEKDTENKEIREKLTAEKKSVAAELAHYQEHYHAAIGQREQLKAELAAWQSSYNAISQSHFWRLTAPARKICNGIKKILKSNRVTYLFCKGLLSLKREGVKVTWRKVKMKYSSRYRLQEIVKNTSLSEQERRQQEETVFPKDIKFSILVPLYNTPINFLEEMIVSVIAQTYGNWELCLADGSDKEHGNVEKAVKKIKANDKRIKYQKLEKNLGISDNTNICIEMATGDYIALFDHDDLLHPAALFEVMKAICERNADFVYTDENTFSQNVQDSYCPHFKPDFSPDTLRSYNYICHLSVFKKSLLDKIGGGFRREFDGSQDYDMILRLTEKAHHIVHIPKILYFWRAHINSVAQDVEAKPYAITAAKKALTEHLKRVELEGEVIDSSLISTYKINYKIKGQPLISIIIPSKDHLDDLDKCLRSIKEKSTYKNYEIIIVENNSIESSTFDYYKKIEGRNIRVVYWKHEFNYSKINNFGVKHSKGDYILLLNNDIEIITENWLEEMLMFAQRRDVGAVGAMLYYPDETIQHAGVILGIGGVAGHSHKHFPRKSYGYASRLTIAQNLSCVTAACLLTKRAVWDEIGGLNDAYQIAFNDVDLCMRIRRAGYLIVWTPYAEAYHYESKSRGYEDTPEKQKRFSGEVLRFMGEWKSELEAGDPYYNPNLSLVREDFSLR